MRLMLASSSPRRQDLLRAAGFSFEVMSPDVDETLLPGESPGEAVKRLAEAKMRAVRHTCPGAMILAADTVVVLEGGILGKPADAAEAGRMLRALSGRDHAVITGFALGGDNFVHVEAVSTRVRFRDLTDAEIDAYVASGEPMDKAGGYGIQSGAAHMVRSIEGSYTNVVGLPMAEVAEAVRAWGL
ncbi:MAG: septum formation inhibitor Maf [Verrucomicrobia bacterium]|nr:septum formation inhibitor Maf [Verrucomicrobiota bacterium]MCH8528343.1 Maf family protein [Kiritimatiellia bacterium]